MEKAAFPFSLISNTCGGYTFYKDAKLLRITRYRYNDVPGDINGKYFYIKDGDTVWNPGWKPTQTELDSYECRHGIGYSRFTGSKNQVEASVLTFVPMNDNCEISQVKLTNNSAETKTLSLFSYVEWCLWNADNDAKNFQRNLSIGEVEVIGSTIYHKTEYRERRNHYAVYSVNATVDGFDTSRDEFLGAYRGADKPIAVEEDACRNSIASGWSPIASHQIKLTLAPGESKTFVFVLGYVENPEDDKDKKIAELEEQVKKLDTELLAQKTLVEKQKEEIDKLVEEIENLQNSKEFVSNLTMFTANKEGYWKIYLKKDEKVYY